MVESISNNSSRSSTTHLTPDVCDILSASLSPSAKVLYKNAWLRLLRFDPSISNLPVANYTICNFIAFLFKTNFSSATIASNISAISFVHKILGTYDPTQSFLVRKLLRGCQNLSKPCDSRLPITPELLKRIIEALPKVVPNYHFQLLIQAVFLIAFNAFMRLGELFARNPSGQSKILQRDDVSFLHSQGIMGAQLILRDYKHNKEKTPLIIFLTGCPGSNMCPVDALAKYLSVFKHNSGPLFQFMDGKPVPGSFITAQLHKIIEFLGLNSKYYKGHSFRIGAATHAANLGFSENYIQKLGRWKSNAMRRYIRISAFKL